MSWTNTKRVIRSGWIGFWRNGIVSIASILVMTITLSVVASIIFSRAILTNSLNDIKNKVDITVYFKQDASEDRILTLEGQIQKLPEVADVNYVSADQALADFKAKHANDSLTLQALDELDVNPLGAYVTIKAKDASQYESIAGELGGNSSLISNSSDIIDNINYSQNKDVIDRLVLIIDNAEKLGLALAVILALISVVITFNTIRLSIYFAKEEISIMRLVGAGGGYVRGPFLIQGTIYGIISSIITLLVFLPVAYWLGRAMTTFLGIDMFAYYLSHFLKIFLIIIGSGVLLGVFSSFLAVNKYLNR